MALENAITEALEKGRQVFLVGLQGQAEERLKKLGVMEKIASANIISDRITALRHAVSYLDEHVVDFGHDIISPQAIS